MVNYRQIIAGIVILLTGLLVYLVDRPAESAVFIRDYVPYLSLYTKMPSVFGSFGNSLPALFHVLAFSLMTAGFVKAGKAVYIKICLFWVTINLFFEFGQKFSLFYTEIFSSGYLRAFFENGTFDYFDVFAFLAGGSLAYTFLIFTGNKESVI